MSRIIEVSSDWLALREAEDARARSAELAAAVPALLPAGTLTVHDLGSGTGSMVRWLAPRLPGPQTWVLHDWNADLTRRALDVEAPRDREGAPVSLVPQIGELGELSAAHLNGAALVTASALLDVLTAREAHSLVDACVGAGAPALLSLSVTGEVHLRPRDAGDSAYSNAFNTHQTRETDGRRLLGRHGAPIVKGLFELAGWKVRTTRTHWLLDAGRTLLLQEWLNGWVDAAEEQDPGLRERFEGYRDLRSAQLARGRLSVDVVHTDLLAWPR